MDLKKTYSLEHTSLFIGLWNRTSDTFAEDLTLIKCFFNSDLFDKLEC